MMPAISPLTKSGLVGPPAIRCQTKRITSRFTVCAPLSCITKMWAIERPRRTVTRIADRRFRNPRACRYDIPPAINSPISRRSNSSSLKDERLCTPEGSSFGLTQGAV